MREDGSVEELSEFLRHDLPTGAHLPPGLFIELCARGFHFGHSTVMMQRARVREVGGFDPSQTRRHDMDLWMRVLSGHSWAYEPRFAALYRVDTPGSISKNVVDCEYFYLRALLKNREGFEGAAMNALVRTAAQRLMSLSFVDGASSEFSRARRLAWPHLRPAFRAFYLGACACRPLFRAAIQAKRRWVWRHEKAEVS